jgi:hypothetical protein
MSSQAKCATEIEAGLAYVKDRRGYNLCICHLALWIDLSQWQCAPQNDEIR